MSQMDLIELLAAPLGGPAAAPAVPVQTPGPLPARPQPVDREVQAILDALWEGGDSDRRKVVRAIVLVGRRNRCHVGTPAALCPRTGWSATASSSDRRKSMNITEANDTQTLLRWVLELATFEHRSGYDAAGYGRSTVTDTELLHAVTALAERSSKALGAGIGPAQAQADARTLLALAGDTDPDTARDDVDDEDAVQAVEVPS